MPSPEVTIERAAKTAMRAVSPTDSAAKTGGVAGMTARSTARLCLGALLAGVKSRRA
jgi:hypothetical protein